MQFIWRGKMEEWGRREGRVWDSHFIIMRARLRYIGTCCGYSVVFSDMSIDRFSQPIHKRSVARPDNGWKNEASSTSQLRSDCVPHCHLPFMCFPHFCITKGKRRIALDLHAVSGQPPLIAYLSLQSARHPLSPIS